MKNYLPLLPTHIRKYKKIQYLLSNKNKSKNRLPKKQTKKNPIKLTAKNPKLRISEEE